MSIGPIGAQSVGPAQMMSAASMVSLYALMSAGPGASGSAALLQSLQAQAASDDQMMSLPVAAPVTITAPTNSASGGSHSAESGGSARASSGSPGHLVDEYA